MTVGSLFLSAEAFYSVAIEYDELTGQLSPRSARRPSGFSHEVSKRLRAPCSATPGYVGAAPREPWAGETRDRGLFLSIFRRRGLRGVSDSVLRQIRPARFKTIALHHVEDDPRLSWKAVGLLTYMLTRPGTSDSPWKFNRADIVNRHTDGIAAVKAGLKELRETGYLLTRSQPTGGWEWLISDRPMTASEWAEELDPKVENRTDGPEGRLSAGGKSTHIPTKKYIPTEKNYSTSVQTDLLPKIGNGPKPLPAEKEAFEDVWALSRTGGKRPAWEQYRKAVPRKVSAERLHEVRERYVAHAERNDFTPAALFRWIRDERWGDDVPDAQPRGGPPEFGRLRPVE